MFFRFEYLTTMPNELTSTNVQLAPPLVFVDRISILFPLLFSFADRIHDLISRPLSLFQSPPKPKSSSFSQTTSPDAHGVVIARHENWSMSREEVKFVMGKLEMFCSEESEGEIGERFGFDEVTGVFVESEPSLEELKQTFDVFDKNRDGFIDGEELHRVLGLLFNNHGMFIHDCNRMIARFDHNKDGRIDFNEFVKFMEIALS